LSWLGYTPTTAFRRGKLVYQGFRRGYPV